MVEHIYQNEIFLPATLEQAFAFFQNVQNLAKITPPWVHFEIITPPPLDIYEGREYEYKLKVNGIPMHWKTLISVWEPPHRFVDVQLKGPYKTWVHEHSFFERENGVLMIDTVRYQLPLGFIGELIHIMQVKKFIKQIFEYRNQIISAVFSGDVKEKGSNT
ncbi:MAG: SRPBCC family protein [Calditrichia bacterium]